MESSDRPILIYALTDPDTGGVRYIGQTKNLWRRYVLHLTRLEGTSAKVAWLKDMEAKDQIPGLRVLGTVAADEAAIRERHFLRPCPAGLVARKVAQRSNVVRQR
jgi:hypothetical protein